jgi:type 1 glutamine amidotransferase
MSGDEEYRSEEGLPMLGKILAVHHGFKCTVLFPIGKDGVIDPNTQTNIPGIEQLATADMAIVQWRFRELPDDKMKYFVDYLNSGKPILGLRTATHSFQYERNPHSPYAKFDYRNREWPGGFGQQVFGDTWVDHHGIHGKESTRGLINGLYSDSPIMRGVKDIWGPTDVYSVKHLPPEAKVLVYGLSLRGMNPTDAPNYDKSVMPLIWTKTYKNESGTTNSIMCSTIGAAVDLQNEDLRRLFVNACYWATGLGDKIPKKANVDYVGEFHPTFFGFNKYKPGVKPSEHEMK